MSRRLLNTRIGRKLFPDRFDQAHKDYRASKSKKPFRRWIRDKDREYEKKDYQEFKTNNPKSKKSQSQFINMVRSEGGRNKYRIRHGLNKKK